MRDEHEKAGKRQQKSWFLWSIVTSLFSTEFAGDIE